MEVGLSSDHHQEAHEKKKELHKASDIFVRALENENIKFWHVEVLLGLLNPKP